MLKKFVALLYLFIFSACFQTLANATVLQTENTDIELLRLSDDTFLAQFTIKEGWHIYWLNSGEIGKPTTISGDVKLKIINTSIPKIKLFYDSIEEYIYHHKAYYLFKAENANISQITFSFTECNDVCQAQKLSFDVKNIPIISSLEQQQYLSEAQKTFPQKINLVSPAQRNELTLTHLNGENVDFIAAQWQLIDSDSIIVSKSQKNIKINWLDDGVNKLNQALIIVGQKAYLADIKYEDMSLLSLIYIIVLAFLGGIILNAMPCVFPILSLKIFALIKQRHSRKRALKEALGYTFGVLFSFLLLTLCIIYLKNKGENVGWGFQLQSPLFVAVMALVFLILFLFMIEWLHFPTMKRQAVYKLANLNAFCTGFFAVLIASPCTGPFMGAAVGYAIMGTTAEIYAIFTALALGYACPYALIQLYPQALKNILPKPGKWMRKIKIIFAIPLLITSLWLCMVFYKQIANTETIDSEIIWQPFDADKIAKLNEKGENIFINFTAEWCLTCKFNKKLLLSGESFNNFVNQNKVHLFEADMTEDNEEYTMALKSYGRAGIPTYVYYSNKSFQVLPMFFSVNNLNE